MPGQQEAANSAAAIEMKASFMILIGLIDFYADARSTPDAGEINNPNRPCKAKDAAKLTSAEILSSGCLPGVIRPGRAGLNSPIGRP